MKLEEELEFVSKQADQAVTKVVGLRQSLLQLAHAVHFEHHDTTTVKLWRQCKHPICRKFLEHVKRDGR